MTEITCDIFVCVVGVWQREFLDLWCVCAWCDELRTRSQLVAPGTHTTGPKNQLVTAGTHTTGPKNQLVAPGTHTTGPEHQLVAPGTHTTGPKNQAAKHRLPTQNYHK